MAILVRLLLLASMALPFLWMADGSAQLSGQEAAAHAAAAQAAEQRNDFPAAVREYEIVARLLPSSAEVQSNLGVALYFNHEYTPALAVFRKAIAIEPDLLAPHLFAGLSWYQLSDPDAAVPELERAVRIHPSDVIARTWLGYAYSAQSHAALAVREFAAAAKLDPKNVDIWYALGQSWLALGKEATLKLLAIAPDSARVWQLAAEQALQRNDRATALDYFRQADLRRPGIAEVRQEITGLGGTPGESAAGRSVTPRQQEEDELYRRAHDSEEQARAALEQVERMAPDSWRAHEIMADSLILQGKDEDAIQEYRAVLQQKPDLPGIHQAIGEALVRAGKLPGALQEFHEELQIQPRSAAANMNAGRVELMMGNDDAAGKLLKAAMLLHRPPAETWVLLAKLDLRRHDDQDAIALLSHYLVSEKGDSTAYYLLATAYREAGDRKHLQEAMDMYLKTSRDLKERSGARRELDHAGDTDRAEEKAAVSAPPEGE